MTYRFLPRCQFCDEKFVPRGCGDRYCSKACRKEYAKREARLKRETAHPPVKKNCRECQKDFKTVTYGAKFCSEYCKDIAKAREKNEAWAKREPKKRKRQDLKMQMFYELRDKPSDSALKKWNACRG